MSNTSGASTATTETTKRRGRTSLTDEQKEEKQRIYDLFHGGGKDTHTVTVGIKVSSEERSMLRSFAKSVSTETLPVSIDDVFAGVIRKFAFGVPFNHEKQLDAYNTSIASRSEEIKNSALEYDRTHDTGEIAKLRKQVDKLAEMKAAFIRRGAQVPKFLETGIDELYAAINELSETDGGEEALAEAVAAA